MGKTLKRNFEMPFIGLTFDLMVNHSARIILQTFTDED